MAMGRLGARQDRMMVLWDELPTSPGHVFYDRQTVLQEARFDAFAEKMCQPFNANGWADGRCHRDATSAWRCTDSLLLRDFLALTPDQRVPDHSWLSRTRARLPLEVHEEVFSWVLERRPSTAGQGRSDRRRWGDDGSAMEANAAMRSICRRDTGESYRERLRRVAKQEWN